MFDDDLIGWQLDDVLEDGLVRMENVLDECRVDFVVDGVAIDSCGEPSDPLLDEHTRSRLDHARPSPSQRRTLDFDVDENGDLLPAEMQFSQLGGGRNG